MNKPQINYPLVMRHRFFPALHSLRGLAALWVLVFHTWYFSGEKELIVGLDKLFKVGWLGVHLFYALSAFLLTMHLLKAKDRSYGLFFKRRFLRIFPAYWFQLILLVALGAWVGLDTAAARQYWPEHIFMFFNLPPRVAQPMNGVWWTLPVEFGFYLLLPVLLWMLLKLRPLAFFVFAVATTIAFRFVMFRRFGSEVGILIEQLPGVLSVFGAGMVAAWWMHSWPERRPVWLLPVALLGFIAWIAVLLVDVEGYWKGSVLLYVWGSVSAVFISALIAALFDSEKRLLAHGVPVWLGEVSYGIYLWHLPVILSLLHFQPRLADSMVWLTLAVLPFTLLLAWISLRWVERPAMKLGRGKKAA
ncbi:MAG: acyltransferase [Gammaproteobacteria bacterium]|nr:acyltransferase [Gammaproteobacteria bacterium]MBT8051758.1 acyltransferase [Gammaproteobacteria bacterium]MBT8055465.1 acyltransferase [Gammaproteobacteria bacterium]NNJ78833.1 acyltransferase [Xanthomonadales bacterium]